MIHIETCLVPGGDYCIGDEHLAESHPIHTITLPGFEIGAGAITNSQFGLFITAGGYRDERLWNEMGWRWQKHKQAEHPAFWQDVNFNHPLQPVVGVCWYEADAFARWLASETRVSWHLPSEVQWEASARDPQNPQAMPQWSAMNCVERGIGRPWMSIGFGNRSWCGAWNLLGNVWEWTSSRWGRNWQTFDYDYPYQPDDGREDPEGSYARVMRGGSWFDRVSESNPARRGRYLPGSRASNIGFRVMKWLES